MAFGIDININELIKRVRQLNSIVLTDLKPFEKELGAAIRASVAENFANEGIGNQKWAMLADSTIRKRGNAHPILEVTGALKRAATTDLKVQVDGSVLTASIKNRKLSRIAGILTTGYKIKKKNDGDDEEKLIKELKPRPFLVATDKLAEIAANIVLKGQQESIRRAFAAD